ncbi:MAG: class I SAM-dependent methyltransferase [Proteobacteria bacterium]|nr:class I SAM-dependent methyltransferase [Pseudomonadota bacterium]
MAEGLDRNILIFPAGMPGAVEFLGQALGQGRKVIGASSLKYDPVRDLYPEWAWLPYVSEPDFDEAFALLAAGKNVGEVYTPHPAIWRYLRQALGRLAPEADLINDEPLDANLAGCRAAMARARSFLSRPLGLASLPPTARPLTFLEASALFRSVEAIPGQCDHQKVAALCEIARCCPRGDVVEIGSLWGKSAFVLNYLSGVYGLGPVLCIDPWDSTEMIQNDKGGLVDDFARHIDLDEALTLFQINLLPTGRGNLNFLRLPSVEAAVFYRGRGEVGSAAFGQTVYSRQISLLHIDGNHGLEAVRSDLAAWSDLMVPGGWIVIDDYLWPFGHGPRIAADELLTRRHGELACAFVSGGALFVQIGDGVINEGTSA